MNFAFSRIPFFISSEIPDPVIIFQTLSLDVRFHVERYDCILYLVQRQGFSYLLALHAIQFERKDSSYYFDCVLVLAT